MTTFNRRSFIKRSAMLTALASAVRLLPMPASGNATVPNWQGTPHPYFTNARNTPEVIAHRGGNGQWPGETMRAFREAAKLKVDVLEMDVFLSANGELMLMHDHDVEVTTDGEGKINKLHSDQLQRLNAGHKWSPDGTSRPFKDVDVASPKFQDLKVPRLEEVFGEFPDTRMVIEMKKADKSPAAALSAMIRKHGMTNKVLVASFVGNFMTEFRRLNPEVATSFSLSKGDVKRLVSGKKILDEDTSDPRAIQLPYRLITEEVVRRAHERNI